MTQPSMPRMIALSLLLGVLAGAAGSLFMELIDGAQHLFFTTVPESLGWAETPWWWAAGLLFLGATGVMLARRLPGHTGGGPLTGFHFDDPLSMVPSVLLAAFCTLAFGLVLGPEAPLIVLGTAVGGLVTWKAEPQARRAAMLLGGVAAIGAVFGNPFVTGFMILEFAAVGLVPAVMITPAFVALGAGYLTMVGIGSLPGFGVHSLSVPGLPAYDEIAAGDLVRGVVVAIVAAVVTVLARGGAVWVDRLAQRHAVPVLYAAAGVTAAVLLVAQVGFGVAQNQILFSGNEGMGELVAQTSTLTVLVIIVGKAIAYAVALGGGFRGGPVFPAVFLGVAVAVLASLVMPTASLSPMAAAGVGAAAAAMLKLPATSALLGAVVVGGGGAVVAPFAIFGAVIGLMVRMGVDRRLGVTPAPGATTGTAAPAASG